MEVLYSKEHEWIKLEGATGVVGITEYAAGNLGDITFVDLPAVGKEVEQFGVLCGVESVKAASDIYAPLAGKVVEVNDQLEAHPEIINESAEDKGWIARIAISDEEGKKDLLNRAEYEEYVKGLS